MSRADQFHGTQRIGGTHRKVIADGQGGNVNHFVADQLHVAEQTGVARQINFVARSRD